jgi:hypothetical protein
MKAYTQYSLLIICVLVPFELSFGDTTIILKNTNTRPIDIGRFNCQLENPEVHTQDLSAISKVLLQYGDESSVRAEWFRSELSVDHKVGALSYGEFISLLTLVVTVVASIIIARIQHSHNKKSQAKLLTMKICEEYLSKDQEFIKTLELLDAPLKTTPSSFSAVRRIRAWLDIIAALYNIGDLDREMLIAMGIANPLKNWISKFLEAAQLIEQAAIGNDPAALLWVQRYRNEINESNGIFRFLDEIEGEHDENSRV